MELALKITSNAGYQDAEKIQHRTYKTTENVETIVFTIPSNVMVHVQKANFLVENIVKQALHTTWKITDHVEINASTLTIHVMERVKRDSLNVENIAKRTQHPIKQITELVVTIV